MSGAAATRLGTRPHIASPAASARIAAASALFALSAAAAAPSGLAVGPAQLAERYYEARLALFPLAATEDVGDSRFDGVLEIEIAPEHRARQYALYTSTLKRLEVISPETLSERDRLTLEVLRFDATRRLEALDYPGHLMPLDHIESVPAKLAQWASGQGPQPLVTVADHENYLRRLSRLPDWVEQSIANMREGIKRGVVRPRVIVERMLPQFEALAADRLEANPYYAPAKRLAAGFTPAQSHRLRSAYGKTVSAEIVPAMRRLNRFLREEYLPSATVTAGLGALPGGVDWYRYLARDATTTNLSPQAMHATGLSEVARIRAEMERVKGRIGEPRSLDVFLKSLNERSDLKPFRTEQEVVARFAAIDRRIRPGLVRLFGRLPKAPMEIRPVDPLVRDTAQSSYTLPAANGSRPGVFYAAVPDPRAFSTPTMTAMLLHEGMPGHHLQGALAQELDLPRMRRFDFYDAYGEGWALYAEGLGKELGVYDDPFDEFGRLQMELVRAVRLVTDTGLHAMGWSRERTIRYMMETEGSSEAEARRSTERYMVLPGQALSYKVGEITILALREEAKRALGTCFDVRAFHDALLEDGAMPLFMLEAKMRTWIARKACRS